jgi:DNA-binding CsgD family transcriptional regulator
MRKQPRFGEATRAAATIQPLDPTMRQLAVLDAFAETGTYELTAAITGIHPGTVRNLLIEIRGHYGAATTIQAYRAALAAGDLSTPAGHGLAVRS